MIDSGFGKGRMPAGGQLWASLPGPALNCRQGALPWAKAAEANLPSLEAGTLGRLAAPFGPEALPAKYRALSRTIS